MLARPPKIPTVDRRQTAPTRLRIVFSNDRPSDGHVAGRPRRGPALLCRWHLGENQRLFCTWEGETREAEPWEGESWEGERLDVILPADLGRLRRT